MMKKIRWVGSSKEDLRKMPKPVKAVFGQALYDAQKGGHHPNAKPLKGFHGSGVVELIEDYRGNAYRAVYTVRFKDTVYVLHAFMKKSKKGIETPREDKERIRLRLQAAQKDYEQEKKYSN
ncbi:MAG: type II toxin-antitoxin system RelE/ParE family toxin [Candidatus Omnitrophota bacterium]